MYIHIGDHRQFARFNAWYPGCKDMYMCLYTCTHIYIYMYVYVCIYIDIHRCIYVYIYIYIDVYRFIYIYVCIHIYVYMCIYIYLYTFIYTCMHIYIYIYTYTHIHIPIFTMYVHIFRNLSIVRSILRKAPRSVWRRSKKQKMLPQPRLPEHVLLSQNTFYYSKMLQM